MGTFFHAIMILGPDGEETVEALVDTGASLSTIPPSLLLRLGVVPCRRARLHLADGQYAVWGLGRVLSRTDEMEENDICSFGPEESPPVIGAQTLQAMLLGVGEVGSLQRGGHA